MLNNLKDHDSEITASKSGAIATLSVQNVLILKLVHAQCCSKKINKVREEKSPNSLFFRRIGSDFVTKLMI